MTMHIAFGHLQVVCKTHDLVATYQRFEGGATVRVMYLNGQPLHSIESGDFDPDPAGRMAAWLIENGHLTKEDFG